MYAAWRNEGTPLNAAMSHELDSALERIERYRTIAAGVRRRVPGIVAVKGLEIADLYPAGSTRHMNDLDYVADEARLWKLVDELTGDGWDLDTATFVIVDGRLHVLACLRLPHKDPFSLPYGVEITTYVTIGNLAGVAPIVELPAQWRDPPVKNLLMLLYERFEQPYRARDLVDASLLMAAVSDLPALWDEIERLRLWPEYTELAGLQARADLPTAPDPPRSRQVAVAGSRARRAGRRLAELRHPAAATAKHLQRRLVLGSNTTPERLLWAAAGNRLNAGTALRAGLLCFGLPIPGIRPDTGAATVRERDGLTFVDTPSARFLLTAGEAVEQDAVDRLAADAGVDQRATATPVDAGTPLP
jgi:hypothetical protein